MNDLRKARERQVVLVEESSQLRLVHQVVPAREQREHSFCKDCPGVLHPHFAQHVERHDGQRGLLTRGRYGRFGCPRLGHRILECRVHVLRGQPPGDQLRVDVALRPSDGIDGRFSQGLTTFIVLRAGDPAFVEELPQRNEGLVVDRPRGGVQCEQELRRDAGFGDDHGFVKAALLDGRSADVLAEVAPQFTERHGPVIVGVGLALQALNKIVGEHARLLVGVLQRLLVVGGTGDGYAPLARKVTKELRGVGQGLLDRAGGVAAVEQHHQPL